MTIHTFGYMFFGPSLGTLLAHWPPDQGGSRSRVRREMPLTCLNAGGRGRYRTADRWCVNPKQTVYRVSRGAVAS